MSIVLDSIFQSSQHEAKAHEYQAGIIYQTGNRDVRKTAQYLDSLFLAHLCGDFRRNVLEDEEPEVNALHSASFAALHTPSAAGRREPNSSSAADMPGTRKTIQGKLGYLFGLVMLMLLILSAMQLQAQPPGARYELSHESHGVDSSVFAARRAYLLEQMRPEFRGFLFQRRQAQSSKRRLLRISSEQRSLVPDRRRRAEIDARTGA